LNEQLELLLATAPDPRSRAVLVEGASHFSPIRVEAQLTESKDNDLFQLGEELVGVQPLQVQALLGEEIITFLEQLTPGRQGAASQGGPALIHRQAGSLHLHRINAEGAIQLLNES